MNANTYPHLWRRGLIQFNAKRRAAHQCEHCGMRFSPDSNLALTARRKDGRAFVGTVHHIDHNKANCSMANLVYLCQSCHYVLHLFDWKPNDFLLLRWGDVPPRWLVARAIPYRLRTQKSLWSDDHAQA